ncbi:MAG TPA: preprotein translocase subunit SecY [Oligoflexia bacterium]|nr:preprotein translocase subunit SecY [Oligoflexia bacterium]HMP26479.1 preprotein translocase subunit SecY [Oligoflexia bacterium]
MVAEYGNIFKIPELKRKVLFTLGMLMVYRLGVFVATPGIDVEQLRRMFDTSSGTFFGLFNMFSGGALENFSIFTLGIAPYISVSILIQLLTPTIPALEALRKEGEAGKRILTRYTRYGTILLALFQSFWIARGLESQGLALYTGWQFRITTMVTLTAGAAFIMWLGEQITERGIGNGISIVIFSGIVARMPGVLASTIGLARSGEINPAAVLLILAFAVCTVLGIVFVERSSRKIPVQYPKRVVGGRLAPQQTQYMPLKINMAGVIPPIFASAFLTLVSSIFSFSATESWREIGAYFLPGSWAYLLIFATLIIIFSFFYTAVIFNPIEVSEQLKKNGGSIPTVRPGKETADYFYGVLSRLTFWGAIYITLVCLAPQEFYLNVGATYFSYVFGGTAILIVVGVTLDTASQIESLLVARNYEDFMNQTAKAGAKLPPGFSGTAKGRLARK